MKKVALLFIFINTWVIPSENKIDILSQKAQNSSSCWEIFEKKKLRITSFCCMYPALKDALFTINTLTSVNKGLTRAINDTILLIIKDVSDNYKHSNECIAPLLCIKKADKQMTLQRNLISYYRGSTPFSYMEKDIRLSMSKADVNFTYGKEKETPLMRALLLEPAIKSASIMQLLLANGADICLRNRQGENALMILLKLGYRPGTGILIDAGEKNRAFLAQKDNKGNTLLHCCLEGMKQRPTTFPLHIPNLKRLLKLGVNPTIKNDMGQTPYMLAEQFGNQFSENGKDKTPFMVEVLLSNQEIIDLLAEAESNYLKHNFQ